MEFMLISRVIIFILFIKLTFIFHRYIIKFSSFYSILALIQFSDIPKQLNF